MTTTAPRVPAAMRETFEAIAHHTDAFCDKHLNDEYKQLIRQALAALCRKRPSPLLKGQASSWAAGAVHAAGMVNFLFDAAQTPHCQATDIWAHFCVAASTGQNHSKKIRDALGMSQMDPAWTLPSRMDANPLIWMLEVNGYTVDARHLPLEVQDIAFAKGLIPYVPGRKVAPA
ncbi:MAG: hypothetical protein AUK50_10355 [Comamonadaceae bacterium CG2_30_57_122]|nr:MAG: hypothetical protein AUK50_10355 [Comamonadaceae bacterium CG2_30_57_122]